ncbi:MAG: CARDB domain-containing protein [Cyanobacteriota bacterium]|nr:CARDB domain-containing protein [Cyanobacteriota bacterium]
MNQAGVRCWIANTITDLIQGDVHEHLPLERIPLKGDVLGLGTTTSLDNGELTFLHNPEDGDTTIWKCQASDGGVRALHPGDGSSHFPYVCFSSDASSVRTPVDVASLGDVEGEPLQNLVGEAIARLCGEQCLEEAPIYGVRLVSEWTSLVITVASKLCMGQQRRNLAVATNASSTDTASRNIYQLLQHYRLAEMDPGAPDDPIRYLGRSLQWDCCGFYDTSPASGRVTVPDPMAHLHLHGCSTDLRHGGHLHHEHPGTRLKKLNTLVIYPLKQLHQLGSDLGVGNLSFADGQARFTITNHGTMDVSDVGVAVVVDDRYSNHRYLRIPWLAAGGSETFEVPLNLLSGPHRLEVIADPEHQIIEAEADRFNNSARLDVQI